MSTLAQEEVLRLIAQGRINADQAAQLLDALEDDQATEPPPDAGRQVRAWRRRFQWIAWIPFGVGLILLLFSLHWLQTAWLGGHFVWFMLAWLPMALSLGLIALDASSQYLPWLFVNVRQPPGERPRRILLGFPLPVRVLSWGARLFQHVLPEYLSQTWVDELLLTLKDMQRNHDPLTVHVHDDDGTQVDVFIG